MFFAHPFRPGDEEHLHNSRQRSPRHAEEREVVELAELRCGRKADGRLSCRVRVLEGPHICQQGTARQHKEQLYFPGKLCVRSSEGFSEADALQIGTDARKARGAIDGVDKRSDGVTRAAAATSNCSDMLILRRRFRPH